MLCYDNITAPVTYVCCRELRAEVNRRALERDAEMLELRDVGQRVHLAEERVTLARDKLLKLEVQGEAKLKARRQDIDNIVAYVKV